MPLILTQIKELLDKTLYEKCGKKPGRIGDSFYCQNRPRPFNHQPAVMITALQMKDLGGPRAVPRTTRATHSQHAFQAKCKSERPATTKEHYRNTTHIQTLTMSTRTRTHTRRTTHTAHTHTVYTRRTYTNRTQHPTDYRSSSSNQRQTRRSRQQQQALKERKK